MGQVGDESSVAGIAADPAGGSGASMAQAMAAYAPAGGALVTNPRLSQTTTQSTTVSFPARRNNQTVKPNLMGGCGPD